MKRFLCSLVVTLGAFVSPVWAAPLPKVGELPLIVAQAKSFQSMTDLLKEIMRKSLPAPLLKEVEMELFPKLNNQKFPFLDVKKPFGFYGLLDEKLDKCAGVFLIPITEEKDFLKFLTEEEGVGVEKQAEKAGYYKIILDPELNFPAPVGMRFHRGYVYICIGDQTAIDEKQLLLPSQIINEKETAPVSLTIFVDRIPKGLKAVLKELYKENVEVEANTIPADVKPLVMPWIGLGKRYVNLLCDEVKTLQVRFDPNVKETALEVNITPIEKSSLAQSYKERKPSTNQFGSLVNKESLYYQTLQLPTFAPELIDFYQAALDMGQQELLESIKMEMLPREMASTLGELIKVGKATVKSGTMDALMVINGPNKAGEYSAVFAVTMKDADGVAKTLPNMLKGLPKEISDLVKLNANKVGEVFIHEIDLSDTIPEAFHKLTGPKPKIHIAVGKDRGVMTFGADSMGLMKQALEAKPSELPASVTMLNGKKLNVLIDQIVKAAGPDANLGPEEIALFKSLGNQENMKLSEVSIKGGEQLTVRVSFSNTYLFAGFGSFFGIAREGFAPAPGVAPPPPIIEEKK